MGETDINTDEINARLCKKKKKKKKKKKNHHLSINYPCHVGSFKHIYFYMMTLLMAHIHVEVIHVGSDYLRL
ncbi:hypothetical protein HanIR_Chr11g0518901 [Helianthus annuus]|nr:hypothetical protein HanIR_Chr11g0518901 [Helianthus annuus]